MSFTLPYLTGNCFAHFKGFGKVGGELSFSDFGLVSGIKERTLIFAVIIKLMGVTGVKRVNIFTAENQMREFVCRFQIFSITIFSHDVFWNIHRVDEAEIVEHIYANQNLFSVFVSL